MLPADDDLEQAERRLEGELDRRQREDRLKYYQPYPKQAQFHEAGAKVRERLLMAGNQLGKTLAGGFEVAMHATGRYPDWWKGKRFDRPIVAWAAGTTGETVRDTVQRVLIGRPDQKGTGAIPKDAIKELIPARGVADLVDTIRVWHVSGKWSTIGLKTYLSGREKFQGETLDFVWFDEEPPADIYTEGLTRTNIGQNPVWMTFTPLLGVSEVVRRFLLEQSPDRHITTMTIDDVAHYSAEEKARIIASYARMSGKPERRAFRHWALAAFSQFQKTPSASSSEIFHRTGRGSADSTLAGITRSPLSSSCGTATLIASTSADAIGRAR
jgi:phage terminase large subunit-like protein